MLDPTDFDWVNVKNRGLRSAVLRTLGILPANITFLRVTGEGFEPGLTDPESFKPSRSELVDLIDNCLLTLPSVLLHKDEVSSL
jgi:hypothetical protein